MNLNVGDFFIFKDGNVTAIGIVSEYETEYNTCSLKVITSYGRAMSVGPFSNGELEEQGWTKFNP